MPSTFASLERKFMAQVRIPLSRLFLYCLAVVDSSSYVFIPNCGFECVSPGGSFRHFLWQVCKELQSSALSLLLPCPSAAANRNKVQFV